MVSNYNFSTMRQLSLLLLLLSLSFYLQAQSNWQVVDSLHMAGITAFSENFRGEIYLGTQTGDVLRFSAEGELNSTYHATISSPVSAIHTSNGLQTMVILEDQQQHFLLDRV